MHDRLIAQMITGPSHTHGPTIRLSGGMYVMSFDGQRKASSRLSDLMPVYTDIARGLHDSLIATVTQDIATLKAFPNPPAILAYISCMSDTHGRAKAVLAVDVHPASSRAIGSVWYDGEDYESALPGVACQRFIQAAQDLLRTHLTPTTARERLGWPPLDEAEMERNLINNLPEG